MKERHEGNTRTRQSEKSQNEATQIPREPSEGAMASVHQEVIENNLVHVSPINGDADPVNAKTFLTWKLWNQKQRKEHVWHLCFMNKTWRHHHRKPDATANKDYIYIQTKTLRAFQQKGSLVYFALK